MAYTHLPFSPTAHTGFLIVCYTPTRPALPPTPWIRHTHLHTLAYADYSGDPTPPSAATPNTPCIPFVDVTLADLPVPHALRAGLPDAATTTFHRLATYQRDTPPLLQHTHRYTHALIPVTFRTSRTPTAWPGSSSYLHISYYAHRGCHPTCIGFLLWFVNADTVALLPSTHVRTLPPPRYAASRLVLHCAAIGRWFRRVGLDGPYWTRTGRELPCRDLRMQFGRTTHLTTIDTLTP